MSTSKTQTDNKASSKTQSPAEATSGEKSSIHDQQKQTASNSISPGDRESLLITKPFPYPEDLPPCLPYRRAVEGDSYKAQCNPLSKINKINKNKTFTHGVHSTPLNSMVTKTTYNTSNLHQVFNSLV